jgi:hypothetical protein
MKGMTRTLSGGIVTLFTSREIYVLWGVFAFHEEVRGGWYILPEVAAAALLAAVLTLARSPLLADAAEET